MGEYSSLLYDLTLHVHAETQKAYLCSDDGDPDNAKWVPKSQCERGERKHKTKPIYEFTMPLWLVEQRDWM